jgi:hypothetical protein
VERDDVVVDLPVHRGPRSTHIEPLRLRGERRTKRDSVWGAARSARRRSAPATA